MDFDVIIGFLLGELSEEENARIQAKMNTEPEFYQEVVRMERVLMSISAEKANNRSTAIPLSLFQAVQSAESGSDQLLKREPLPVHTRVLAIAASLTILLGVCFGIFKQNELNQKESILSAVLQQKSELEMEFNQVVAAANEQVSKIATYTSNTTRVVPLKSTLSDKDYLGNVYWDQATQKIYFDITNLPHAPAGCSYQLWILINGQPVDAGLIDCHINDLQLSRQLEKYAVEGQTVNAFAVTLEKEGGSENPSLDKMYLYGEI